MIADDADNTDYADTADAADAADTLDYAERIALVKYLRTVHLCFLMLFRGIIKSR